jgi:DNA primase
MDVIALHQAGVTNAVAPCGTAFTDEQAKTLRHWADAAVLVFDSDEAGQKAAVKGIVTCRANGLACSVVVPGRTDDGDELKDPAAILQEFGAGILNKSMKSVILDSRYLITRGKALYDTSTPQGKAQALATLYPYFEALDSEAERNACIEAAADEMRIDKAAALADYERWRRTNAPKNNVEEVLPAVSTVRMNDELFLLTVVSVNTHLYPEFRAFIERREIELEDPAAKELYVALEECFRNEESGPDALISRIASPVVRNFIIERGISPEFKGDSKRDPRRLMEDGIRRIKGKKLYRRLSEIGAEMRLRERDSGGGAGGDFQDLIAEKMYIDAEIRMLEGKTG